MFFATFDFLVQAVFVVFSPKGIIFLFPIKRIIERCRVIKTEKGFIGEILNFLIVAFAVFLMMKKFLGFMQNMRKKKEAEAAAAPAAPPAPSAEEKLLTEIRDLLKKN